jgi:DNA helicase-2/ATP-dependent DNA helicase PcrA
LAEFLNQLNPVQQEAVTSINGPSLIIAGAGSGKTRVLTYRIAYLLKTGIPAHRILALTFTNKAAREMKERIIKLTGEGTARELWMGTFHSIFARILRRESAAIGYPSNYTIYDSDDTRSMIRTIIHDMKLDDQAYKPADVARRISAAKNNLITWEQYLASGEIQMQDKSVRKQDTGQVYKEYSRRCRQSGIMDFDDLLVNTNILLRDHQDILRKYRELFDYILVDEYQDTNYAQYAIVNKLASGKKNICVVGDDSQSIYSFRGAKIENILNFRNDYPEYKLFKLEQNYRSTQNIVEAANSLIANNQGRIPKKVWSDGEKGEKIRVIEAKTDREEGFLISGKILETHLRERARFSDFAVLYRTNAQSRILEEACRKQNIPYRVYGSISFYQRKEIKDCLAYFRLAINPNDDESIRRIINFPARGIGKTSMDRLSQAAFSKGVSLWRVLESPVDFISSFNRGTLDKLAAFRDFIKAFNDRFDDEDAYDLAIDILNKSGIIKEFSYDRTPENLSKAENIQELLNSIREFIEVRKEESPGRVTISEYIENIALLTDQDTDNDEDRNRVSLMTIHSAKGLEFPYVFVAGLEEELFPNQFSVSSARELEEERRLFYVAITRAMRQVFISYAETRYKWGNLVSSRRSRFIREISAQYLDMEERPDQFGFSSKPGRTATMQPQPTPSSGLTRIKEARNKRPQAVRDDNFQADDPENIQSGMTVEHARFGEGKVLQVEGEAPNRKAVVFFKTSGQKQLLLKFARLKILKH